MKSLDKLNKCLQELDTLESVAINPPPYPDLRITFGSPDGGSYEDISLIIDADSPTSFHLPYYLCAEFAVRLCFAAEAKKLLPPNIVYAEHEICLQFYLQNEPSEFYIYCARATWQLTGQSSMKKNDHELYDEGEIAPYFPQEAKEELEKFAKVMENVTEKVIGVLKEELEGDEK